MPRFYQHLAHATVQMHHTGDDGMARADKQKASDVAPDTVTDVDAMAGPALSFEDALAALEATVVRLERGDLSLEESLVAYERGVKLVHAAKGRLDSMQTRLDQLLEDGTLKPLKKRSDHADSTAAADGEGGATS